MSDNIIEFPSKENTQNVDDCAYIETFTFNIEGYEISEWDVESMNKLFSDMVTKDFELDRLSDACFDLQLLCDQHPEIVDFVTANIRRLTESMSKKLKNS